MEIVKYHHAEGDCTFELELEVEHRKSVYFRCPTCVWISEFRPIENYDSVDSFNLNSFKVVDESLFEPIKKLRKTKTKRNTNGKVRTIKLNPVGQDVYRFNFSSKQVIKQIIKDRKNEDDN